MIFTDISILFLYFTNAPLLIPLSFPHFLSQGCKIPEWELWEAKLKGQDNGLFHGRFPVESMEQNAWKCPSLSFWLSHKGTRTQPPLWKIIAPGYLCPSLNTNCITRNKIQVKPPCKPQQSLFCIIWKGHINTTIDWQKCVGQACFGFTEYETVSMVN